MSSGPTFYGNVPTSPVSFVMVNILRGGKWIHADSNTVDKLLGNLQLVQDAGEFAFYTHPDSATSMDQIAHQYMYGGKRFKFHIAASISEVDKQGKYTGVSRAFDLYLSECELLFATGFPPTFGVRFEASNLAQRARTYNNSHQHHGQRRYDYGRSDYGRYGYGRYDRRYGYDRQGYGRRGYGGSHRHHGGH